MLTLLAVQTLRLESTLDEVDEHSNNQQRKQSSSCVCVFGRNISRYTDSHFKEISLVANPRKRMEVCLSLPNTSSMLEFLVYTAQ